MTQDFRFALWGEDEDHDDERLWALCESAENLFADPPAPVRRRYELLGCAFDTEVTGGLGFLALAELDKAGEPHWGEWFLEDVRVLGSRPCARDLSLVDVAIEAVRCDQQADYPHRRPLSVGFQLTVGANTVLGRCRDLAEVTPPQEPAPHSARLLGCTPYGPLRDVLEGRKRRLAYRRLQALDTAGECLASAGHPEIVDWQPSPFGAGRYDLTVHTDPLPLVCADIWPLWQDGHPKESNLWARFDRIGREHWLDPALDHQSWQAPDRAAGATYHLDGRHVTDDAGFFCALGEAINGPGGYFGRCLNGVSDALRGHFGATTPFSVVWHDHEVARRCLGVQPLTSRPHSFSELLDFLREHRIEVTLA
ncbi:hypothetical protein [Streptomyces sp. NPDC059874]|uniref:barstar family protein n=1 Tax=Streptomyces sp. NPDC059874 TaxID=3346983 RepID=UPI003646F603